MFFLFLYNIVVAQNTFKAIIRNDKTKEVLKGASVTVSDVKLSAASDTNGFVVINNIPNGKFQIQISYVGFSRQEKTITFPLTHSEQVFEFGLEPQPGELAEVVIETTRTNQNLSAVPTRIEALPLEELDEKSTMRPGDIKMLLGEATGIHVQQTSPVSGTASFRIQGLDSRYTQLLQDGMPLYAGFSGNLSLLQISPLDFKQVEFIKGSASTLYGGGAIAGLVNLISKTPEKKPELTFLLNGTTAKGVDASGYYAQKWQHIGTTILGAYNYNGSYDPSGNGFTAIPLTKRFSITPKVFFYIDAKNSGWFGVNTAFENRYGGDIQVVDGKADNVHQYFERNQTFRTSSQLSFTHKIDSISQLNIKNTIGYFDRQLSEQGFNFRGKQLASFSEINYVRNDKQTTWVAGANLITDHFTDAQNILNYNLTTAGLFAQNTYRPVPWFSLESGIRADYNAPAPQNHTNGVFILPRINALFKLSKQLTSRIGGGLGYKMPTLFNDQSEQDGYQHIQPLNINNTQAEQSYGLNGDINYRGPIGDVFISINQLFFYTHVDHPLVLVNNTFINSPQPITSRGAETNIKLTMDELSFYFGYTYTDARINNLPQTLTPKNRFSFDATYEIENSFRFGAESFYNSMQLLSDGTTGRAYITFGLLVQKMWKHLDIFINAENLTDRRQTRWGSIYTGSITNPNFGDIYAPLDGVVVNAGIRIKLLN